VNQQSPFVHLHVHTEFSLLDGAIRVKSMLEKAARLGMNSVAITDHGNMFGAVQFYAEASKQGIKPIIGCEIYVAPGNRQDRSPSPDGSPNAFHLILLAMNEEGYRNLSRMVTLGNLEGFYYHPRVDMELLKAHNQGLIAMSACLKGIVPYHINAGRMDTARQKAEELASIFDRDRFYFEVQANKMKEQARVNQGLRELGGQLSVPLVATNDCHYLDREDAEAHDVLVCIQTGKTVDDEKRMKFSSDEFYFKTREEMASALAGFEDAIDNTALVADRCHYDMEFGNYKYPVFHVPENSSLEDILTEEAEKGLTRRLAQKADEEGPVSPEVEKDYRDRLQYELGIIHDMGFSGYFLIVADFIEYARGADIPVGPGRGSAAGSLVAYCQAITNIDPIKYGLIFERFLNPQRISMPDIDIDFCIEGRDDVIRYVAEKYGRKNVAQIITFGTMKARGAIRDVGRALSIPLNDVDRIAKLVPEGPKVQLDKAIEEEPDLKKLEQGNETESRLLRISRSLEGLSRHASTHASGVVISDRPLLEYLPLYKIKGTKDEIMTQFTMDQVEKLGLIKFDFLGLKTLTVIKKALKLIRETGGADVDVDAIPLDDRATYQLCSEGRTTGVFQLESSGMKELLRKLRPEVFEDIVALVALYRPGPLGSNMVEEFIAGKHDKSKIKYALPQLEPILNETYGIILYQEQVMKIAQILAEYSLAEADELRKAIGKKKTEVMAAHRVRFVEGSVKNKIDKAVAEKLFMLIDKFGGYGFNKSHSAAYAMIAYQTAYLKAHYPVQFMAALLTQDMGIQDKTIKNLAECREMGIRILPPDVNESRAVFSVVEGNIRFGLAAVKNVGLKAVESMIEERDANGPYVDLLDFCKRVEGAKVNRRVMEGLIECGAFDFTDIYRARLLAALDTVLKITGANHDPNQLSMFGAGEMATGSAGGLFDIPEIEEWDDGERLRKEKEALGFYVTGHPLDSVADQVKRLASCTVQDLVGKKDRSEVKIAGVLAGIGIKRTKKGDKMAIVALEDLTGATQVVIFPDLFSRKSHLLKSDEPVLVTGSVETGDQSTKVIAKELASLNATGNESIMSMELLLDQDLISGKFIRHLHSLVFSHPGECRLRFKISGSNGDEMVVAAHPRFNVLPCEKLLSELEDLTGHKISTFTA